MIVRDYSIFDEYLNLAKHLIEKYGWFVVFTLIAWYVAKPYILIYGERIFRITANSPNRVQILKEDMKKARAKQRILLQANQMA
jgi:hypothetical protein